MREEIANLVHPVFMYGLRLKDRLERGGELFDGFLSAVHGPAERMIAEDALVERFESARAGLLVGILDFREQMLFEAFD